MADAARLTSALKKYMKARGMTYRALAQRLNLSEASVKRVFSTGSFTLQRLGQICEILELDFFDLAKLAHNKSALASRLSRQQEAALASNRLLLLVFHLLLNEWGIGEIAVHYELSKKEIVRQLGELHDLKLIELGARNEVRLLTTKNIDWAHDGPVRKAYQKRLLAEFFDSGFDARHQILRFDGKELSNSSIAVLARKIDRLIRDFGELAELDSPLRREEKQSVVLISAIRPYVLSSFSELKRKERPPPWPTAMALTSGAK
jgi:DNA-binding Xre family transcriptional regulator